jgi:prepilin-type processing-associated H-X9-DG protein/prepilin-type N-terminal cleavage/methylation domain-containing protein
MSRLHRRDAFTLLELCIAIGIVAVLAVMTFSIAKQMAQKSANVRCISNLRTVGNVVLQYAQDHNNDLIPWLTYVGPNQGSHWLYWLWESEYLPRESYDNLKNGVMTCPARGVAGSYDAYKMHYGMNAFPGFDNQITVGSPFHKLTKVQRPSRTFLLADANNLFYISPSVPQSYIYPHDEHANAVFMDGHVETIGKPILPPTESESWPWY